MQWIADGLLEKLLGPYVRLGARTLDLKSGTLTLRDVALREGAFNGRGLPLALQLAVQLEDLTNDRLRACRRRSEEVEHTAGPQTARASADVACL